MLPWRHNNNINNNSYINNHVLPIIVGGDLNLDLRESHGTELIKFMRTELGLELSNDLATSTSRNSTGIDAILITILLLYFRFW